jgi:HemK-related putative methylase
MDVYEPAEDSFLLQKYVQELAIGRVLDMGTGSGVLAITALKSPNTRSVLAVDINKNALEKLQQKKEEEKFTKLSIQESDLFSNVGGEFDTIIFNPPYLPQDIIAGEPIKDDALYGGKQGWELLEKFIKNLGNHLAKNGIALVLFSSFTQKEKVDRILQQNLFDFLPLGEKKLEMFETLYVYKITPSPIRNALISRGVKNITYHDEGKRGIILKGEWNKNSFIKTHLAPTLDVVVAIKVEHPNSKAEKRIENEVKWLEIANKKNIGPRIYFSGEGYYVREFVEGVPFPDFVKSHGKNSSIVRHAIIDLLNQAYLLDTLHVNKEEMHRPNTNVYVQKNGQIVLLDFERCFSSKTPHNVTQFCSFLLHHEYVPKEKMIELSKKYREQYSKTVIDEIKNLIRK